MVEDVPRTGASVWLMFLGFLIPPGLVVYFGRTLGPLPYQTIWLILLGLPALLMLIMLPRKYTLDDQALVIHGNLYRLRIPRARIRSVQPISPARALLAPGSMFCSDPKRALVVERDRGMRLIISPSRPGPFLDLAPSARGEEGRQP